MAKIYIQKPSSRVYVRRRSITRLILEKLAEGGKVFIDAFFPPQYSFTSSGRRLFGLDSNPEVSPRTLSAILSRLKRQGLVARGGSLRSSQWYITSKGKMRLHERQEIVMEIPERDDIPRLVIFDIPECERRNRNIVRTELIASSAFLFSRNILKIVFYFWGLIMPDAVIGISAGLRGGKGTCVKILKTA